MRSFVLIQVSVLTKEVVEAAAKGLAAFSMSLNIVYARRRAAGLKACVRSDAKRDITCVNQIWFLLEAHLIRVNGRKRKTHESSIHS